MDIETRNRLKDIANVNNNALLLIGCKTTKYAHKCCEYNILTIGESNESKVINDKVLGYVQLENIEREKFLEISNKDASFLINNETIIDNNFTISTKIEDINEHKEQIIKQYINSTDIDLTTNIEKANNALNNEGKKVQRIVEDLHEGSSLQEFQLSFNSWASILMYHADVEDENMTSILTDFSLARDNEAEHLELKELSESLNEYLDNHSVDNLERNAKSAIIALEHHQHLELIEALNDVLDVLNNEIGKTKLVARTITWMGSNFITKKILTAPPN